MTSINQQILNTIDSDIESLVLTALEKGECKIVYIHLKTGQRITKAQADRLTKKRLKKAQYFFGTELLIQQVACAVFQLNHTDLLINSHTGLFFDYEEYIKKYPPTDLSKYRHISETPDEYSARRTP